jgi:LysR family transcriptional regulator, low CO2-responsive transcriptional regulator
MLSLYKLEIFNMVAVEGSFSKAAERLFLTQPAVSLHMRDLESALGVPLFQRSSRGVTLTSPGETLLDYTRCILRLVAEAESAVTQVDELSSGQLAIGATPGAGIYLLPGWMQTFQQRYPGLTPSLRTDITPALAAELAAGRLDLAFVEGELESRPSLGIMGLHPITFFLLAAADHPLAKYEQITLEQLHDLPFVTRPPGSQTRVWMDQVFQKQGIRPRLAAEFDHPEAIKEAVASGMGVAIVPEWAAASERLGSRLIARPIPGSDLRRMLKLLWNTDSPLKPIGRAFLSHLSDDFPKLAQLVASEAALDIKLPPREDYKASLRSCIAGRISLGPNPVQ